MTRYLGLRWILMISLLANAGALRAQDSNGPLSAFMLTSTYGVIAGSLTGLASLAFYKEPSENVRNVAMGASLGLYVGILLGAYLVYVPDPSSAAEPEQDESLDEDPMNLQGYRSGPGAFQPIISYLPDQGMNLGVAFRF